MSEWISVKEGMPAECASVLVSNEGGAVANMYYDDGKWFADGFLSSKIPNIAYTGEITHWMPLPDPPKP
jgi:Protein of unknown function (DUF551).